MNVYTMSVDKDSLLSTLTLYLTGVITSIAWQEFKLLMKGTFRLIICIKTQS